MQRAQLPLAYPVPAPPGVARTRRAGSPWNSLPAAQYSGSDDVYIVMTATVSTTMSAGQDQLIAAIVASETPRLRAFLRRRVADFTDAEDILQETFAELVAAYRLMQPIEHAAGWLLAVARNRVVDRLRARARRGDSVPTAGPEGERVLDEWLTAPGAGPDAAYARGVLADELEIALDELPPDQRAVFVAHELEGRTFRELAEATGVGVNTLLWRKHAAVRHLRVRLRAIYEELKV